MRGKWLKNIESLGWVPVGHKLQISYSPLPPKFAVVAEDSPVSWVPSQRQAPSTLLSIKSRMQSSRVMSLVIMLTKKPFVGLAAAFVPVFGVIGSFSASFGSTQYRQLTLAACATGPGHRSGDQWAQPGTHERGARPP